MLNFNNKNKESGEPIEMIRKKAKEEIDASENFILVTASKNSTDAVCIINSKSYAFDILRALKSIENRILVREE